MKFLQTENEKKSFTITTLVFVLLFLLFFLYKFTTSSVEPPVMGGEIAINFGTTEKGKGPVQPTKPIESAPQPEVAPKPIQAAEKIITQKKVEAPVVKTSDKPKVNKEEVKPVKAEPKPTPSKSTNDALASIINGPASKGSAGGQGDSQESGDAGKITGDMYASSTFGSGRGQGAGEGASWGLNGRSLASRGQVVPDCNEQGTVVLQIRVDRSGRVVAANHTKGTTNSAKCLTDAALATAKTFRWKPDTNAPEVQIGFIVINFKVGS